jgi:hypothetical protein
MPATTTTIATTTAMPIAPLLGPEGGGEAGLRPRWRAPAGLGREGLVRGLLLREVLVREVLVREALVREALVRGDGMYHLQSRGHGTRGSHGYDTT